MRTTRSRHKMQQPITQKMHLVQGLLPMAFLNFLLKYSKASFIIYIIAIISAPKATDPT